ncbi:MAG: TrkH family potassium uptake protein [Candidatus Omnitrophica bacterium]|nr:TrkH family potassium uptake protein [Candidatus Omnitrophota bacterium]
MSRMKSSSEKNESFIWSVLHDTGILIHIPAIMSLPVIFICMIKNEWFAITPFLGMAIISLIFGQCLIRFPPQVKALGERPLSMAVVSLSWLLVALLGVIPFMGVAYTITDANPSVLIFREFSNAFFESMSGFTSTGLSMVSKPSQLPDSLQLWRSLMEWVVGAGVVLLALLFMKPAEDKKKLYASEARESLIDGGINRTVKWIWIIYGLYTMFAIFLFYIAGMPFWQSLNHGLTAISTGGFTITDQSFSGYSVLIKLAAIVIILLGAVSFHNHYFFWLKKDRTFPLRQSQIKAFVGCWLVGIILFTFMKFNHLNGAAWIDYLYN